MPKVSFRMASASRESVLGAQTNTARKIHRSDHTEGRLTTAPSGCCVRKGTLTGKRRCANWWRQVAKSLVTISQMRSQVKEAWAAMALEQAQQRRPNGHLLRRA